MDILLVSLGANADNQIGREAERAQNEREQIFSRNVDPILNR